MPAKRGRALEKLLLCRIPASAYLSALCPPSANSSSFRHPRGRIERRGGSLLLRWIFQNQMLSRGGGEGGGEERIRGRGNKGERAWNAPPRYAVLIQPARKIDEPPDFLSNHRRSDTCSPIAQLFPPTSPRSLFAVALDTRAPRSELYA